MTSLLFSGLRYVINKVMTTRVLTLSAEARNVMTTSVTTMFLVEIMSTFKAIKSYIDRLYDKQNITLVVISYEIYQTRRRLG